MPSPSPRVEWRLAEGRFPRGRRADVEPEPTVSTAATDRARWPSRRVEVDEICAAAIISVIILHTVPVKILHAVGAVFSIWKAVPSS